MRRFVRLCMALAIALIPVVANAQQTYTIIDLTAGSPYVQTAANGINRSGQITGFGVTADGAIDAFIYQNGTFTDLGTFGYAAGDGIAINNSGQLAADGIGPGSTALLVTNGHSKQIGSVDGGYTYCYGMNNLGDIVGVAVNGDGNRGGFSYIGGMFNDISTLDYIAIAAAINDSEEIVGSAAYYPNRYHSYYHAFSLVGTTFTYLGSLTGNPATNSQANGIDAAGDIVGYSLASDGLNHAFLYTGGVMQDLGTIEGDNATAVAINNNGVIVGNLLNFYNDVILSSFVYSNGTMTDLGTLINDPNWSGLSVTGINDSGWIVGSGTYNGNSDGFLAVPITGGPIPTTLAFNPSSVTGGASSTGTVTISGPAGVGGLAVALSSANPSVVQVPSSVTVPAGQTTATFTATTSSVTANTNVNVTASANGVSVTAQLTVTPVTNATLKSLKLSPKTVVGGGNSTGKVTLKSITSTDVVVTLSSSNTAVAQTPASVTVPAGSKSASFTITTSSVSTKQSVLISASFGGQSKSATLKVKP